MGSVGPMPLGFVAPPPEIQSSPEPPSSRSLPASPRIVSLPSPPSIESLPAPPYSQSSPAPPRITRSVMGAPCCLSPTLMPHSLSLMRYSGLAWTASLPERVSITNRSVPCTVNAAKSCR